MYLKVLPLAPSFLLSTSPLLAIVDRKSFFPPYWRLTNPFSLIITHSSHAKGLGVILCHSSPSDITRTAFLHLRYISSLVCLSLPSIQPSWLTPWKLPASIIATLPQNRQNSPVHPVLIAPQNFPFPTWPITPNCYIKYGTEAAHLQIFPTDMSFFNVQKGICK